MATREQQSPQPARPARAEPARAGEQGRDFEFTSADFARIRDLIHRSAGISLSDHKRDMAYSRLARRLRSRGLETFKQYLDLLEAQRNLTTVERSAVQLRGKAEPICDAFDAARTIKVI